MEVILRSRKDDSIIVEYPVLAFKRDMMKSNGKMKLYYRVFLEHEIKMYPCDVYYICCITKR